MRGGPGRTVVTLFLETFVPRYRDVPVRGPPSHGLDLGCHSGIGQLNLSG